MLDAPVADAETLQETRQSVRVCVSEQLDGDVEDEFDDVEVLCEDVALCLVCCDDGDELPVLSVVFGESGVDCTF